MKILTQSVAAQVQARRTRRLADLLAPIEELARQSAGLLSKPLAAFHVAGDEYQIPRYLFIGPRGGDDPIRLGLFAAIHGDEPEGANALVQLLQVLEQRPELARDFFLFVYPVCNPKSARSRLNSTATRSTESSRCIRTIPRKAFMALCAARRLRVIS